MFDPQVRPIAKNSKWRSYSRKAEAFFILPLCGCQVCLPMLLLLLAGENLNCFFKEEFDISRVGHLVEFSMYQKGTMIMPYLWII